jgi:WD40 repeat protein
MYGNSVSYRRHNHQSNGYDNGNGNGMTNNDENFSNDDKDNAPHDKSNYVPSNPTLSILSGYGITIWECSVGASSNGNSNGSPGKREHGVPVTRYPHGDLPISTFAWNHNRMVIASASDVPTSELDHPNIVLTSSQTGLQLDSFQHDRQWSHRQAQAAPTATAPAAGVANSLHFGGKSRYLCIGDESGAVCLWDLKKKARVRQFFHDHHPSRQVALDPTDTYVLSLSPDFLSVYTVRDGRLVGRVAPASPGPGPGRSLFTRFHVSPLEPTVAAVGTDEGSVLLYDITDHERSAPLFGLMRRHGGPVTGVAFSPRNPTVLVTSGEDGTVMALDAKTGETLHQVCALSSPITSLSLHSDGTTCAVGCESGEVLLYDLRKHHRGPPLASLQVGGPVKQIQFAPPLRAKDQQMLQLRTGSSGANDGAENAIAATNATIMGSAAVAPTPAKFAMALSPTSSSSNRGPHVTNPNDDHGHATITQQGSSEASPSGAQLGYTGPPGATNHALHQDQQHAVPTAATTRNTATTRGHADVSSPTRSSATISTGGADSTRPRAGITTASMQHINGQQPISPRIGSSPSARAIMSRGMRLSPTKTGSPPKVGSPVRTTTSPTKNAMQSNSEGSTGISVVS